MDRRGVFLTAEWRNLVMLNYVVEPAALLPYVPAGTEIDLWNDRALVSIVAFRFLRPRLLGIPIPFHHEFPEVNLRFYVRRESPRGVRRGVVFIKQIVPRIAVACVARWIHGQNFVVHSMRHDVAEFGAASGNASYEWRVGDHWNRVRICTDSAAELPAPGTEEWFITEHYWAYAARGKRSSLEYEVEHPSWRIRRADSVELECDAEAVYGPRFVDAFTAPPSSAFLVDGSAVAARRGTRLTPSARTGVLPARAEGASLHS